MRKTPISLGNKYGRWTVLALGQTGKKRKWLCRCECGKEGLVPTYLLTSGESSSCGCYGRERRIEANIKHGAARRGKKTNLYNVWCAMIRRCHAETDPAFDDYGGRGVKVCDRWRNDFSAFLADMGDPKPGQSIERDDLNGDYKPENCRWASRLEQNNNQRSNLMIDSANGLMTLAEFVRLHGLNYESAYTKISRGETEISGIKIRVAGRRDSMQPPSH